MSRWVAALRLTGVGFFIGICIVGGTLGGLWLDDRLETRPLFMLGGLIVGLVVAFYGVFQMIRPLMNNRRNKENH